MSFLTMKNITVFERLKDHGNPVDRVALRVGFYQGEHFYPTIPDGRKIHATDTPPKRPEMPKGARDYSGLRHGNMTALWWMWQVNPPRGKARWLCQCDCGKYEIRIPCKWLRADADTQGQEDKCEICTLLERARKGKGKSSKETMPERLMKWIETMRNIGLTDAEITEIRKIENINLHGKTAGQIRQEISELKNQAIDNGYFHD